MQLLVNSIVVFYYYTLPSPTYGRVRFRQTVDPKRDNAGLEDGLMNGLLHSFILF